MEPTQNNKEPVQGGQKMPAKGLAVWFMLLAFFVLLYSLFGNNPDRPKDLDYSAFKQMVDQGRVTKADLVVDAADVRTFYIEASDKDSGTTRKYRVNTDIPLVSSDVEKMLGQTVKVNVLHQNRYLMQVMGWVLPLVLFIALLYFFFIRQMKMAGRGAMNFGKSRARLLTRGKNKVTFSDVAGITEAQEEVQEIIEFLKDPKRFQKLGGRIPKGVLLVGPPGTGKTLLAKAIAGEANVPFFSISGSDFVEMFVGVGASRVRDMFEQGKKNAPCIIFIDEIDAVGRHRFSGMGGGHDEREQTLNALLVEMDGFDTQEGVIIIAATNRPDMLDSALLRPGRFDRQIVVDLPGLDGRSEILKIHARKITLKNEEDLLIVARGTPGFSGADLANLVNEAALIAARRGADAVERKDLEEARDKVRWGRERRSRMMDDDEKKLTACHEAGHAIVLLSVAEAEPLHKVTIIPRGQALGATMQLPQKDSYTQSKGKLLGMMTGLMGGRAAEELACKDITTGAQSDLKQATRIARLMVCEWGMSAELGPQSFGNREEFLFHGREVSRSLDISESTARRIDEEVGRMLHEAYARAIGILRDNRDKLDMVTQLLLERETLDGQDVADILKHGRILTEAERAAAAPAKPAPVSPAGEASATQPPTA